MKIKNYEKVREGMAKIMGGKILNYETKNIFNHGWIVSYCEIWMSSWCDKLLDCKEEPADGGLHGWSEGRRERALNMCVFLLKEGLISFSITDKAKRAGWSEEKLRRLLKDEFR